jgi:hypothetical protein
MGDSGGASLDLFEGDEPFLLSIGTMWLSREHASAFKHRLNALLAEFAALEDRQQHPAYTVCVQLVRGVVG